MVAEIEENIWDVSDTDLVRTDLAKWKGRENNIICKHS